MKCQMCNRDFDEKDIHESHDVPCYLFYNLPSRNERKNRADKLGRRYLCKECHEKYEENLNMVLRMTAMNFSKIFFKEVYKDGDSISEIQ